MGRSRIYRVIRDAIGVQCTAVEFYEMALRHLTQIRLPTAAVQHSAFAQINILKADMSKTTMHLDVAVEDTGVTVAINCQLARARNAADDNPGRLISFPAPWQIDRHVFGQIFVVQRLNSLPQ